MLGYCVKCRTKREMKDATHSVSAKGRHMMKGTCPTCGCKMCAFIKKKASE